MEGMVLDSPKSVFVLYLILSSNFLANLFGCKTQKELSNSMWLKHLLGFMTMYFFIVLVDDNSKKIETPHVQLMQAFAFYLIFTISTKMDYKWWSVFIILLSIIYILQVYKENYKTQNKDINKIEKYQKYLIYINTIILIIGFLIYYGKKKVEYGKDFNHLTFLLGKTNCAFNKSDVKMTDYEAILNVIKK